MLQKLLINGYIHDAEKILIEALIPNEICLICYKFYFIGIDLFYLLM